MCWESVVLEEAGLFCIFMPDLVVHIARVFLNRFYTAFVSITFWIREMRRGWSGVIRRDSGGRHPSSQLTSFDSRKPRVRRICISDPSGAGDSDFSTGNPLLLMCY